MKVKKEFISNRMNKLIHSIHKKCVIIYQNNQQYYSIDQDVFVYKGVFDFNYCYKNKRMVIFITRDYIHYVLKVFRKYHIHYCVIQINYGYNRVLWYHPLNNFYDQYYKKLLFTAVFFHIYREVIKIINIKLAVNIHFCMIFNLHLLN